MLRDLPALSRASIDRVADLRAAADRWSEWSTDPRTRLIEVRNGRTAVHYADGGSGPARLVTTAYVDAGPASGSLDVLLGVGADQAAYLGRIAVPTRVEEAPAEGPGPMPSEVSEVGLREVGALLDDADAGLLTTAVALDAWHRTAGFCSRCGSVTTSINAGWARRCATCDVEHYPRTDPAMIVLVTSGEGEQERALLGRRADWPAGYMSTLAGFVEAGESVERAVIREVEEEAGVRVDPNGLVYLGSQPWPFPCSLMLGFHARAVSTEIDVDGEEIAEARWFTRPELLRGSETGDVRLPPSVSIARRLVEHWFGGPLPSQWERV